MSTLDTTNSAFSPFSRSLIAGGIAGTTVDLSLFPLDTLKTRLQSSSGFLASGGFTGVYRGVGSAVIGSAPGAALFFVTYEHIKSQLQQDGKGYGAQHKAWSDSISHMVAASLGEVAACAVRVPTEVVKQRAQAKQAASSLLALKGILNKRKTHGVVGVWKELYRGWGITILREVPFTVIQFPLWEALKKWQAQRHGRMEATATESAAFGCVSGAVAASATTPLDVLKTRMMLATEKQSLASLASQILRESGPKAFFAGIGPRVGWISAGGGIFLGAYQAASNQLAAIR